MKHISFKYSYIGLLLLLFAGCETIATKEDIGTVQSKVSNVQEDFYETSKVIAERFKTLETKIDKNFSTTSSEINTLSSKTNKLSIDTENISQERILLSTKVSSLEDEIRKLYGKIDELDYKFTEEIKKENLASQQRDFEARRDMKGLKDAYNNIISSISSLSVSLSTIQKDLLAINQAQLKITDGLNKLSPEIEKNEGRILSAEEKFKNTTQILIEEITRQESEIFKLKKEIASIKTSSETLPENKEKALIREDEKTIPPTKRYYTVSKGDSLGALSNRFNVSVKIIREANNLKTDNIYIGQKLLIP